MKTEYPEPCVGARQRIVSVQVQGRFYKKIMRDAKYDYVTITVCTSVKTDSISIKEFHAAIMGSEKFGLSANFTDAKLKWESDKVIYNPI